jgi:hypothetical protein
MIGVHYTTATPKLGDKGDKLLTKKGTRLIHLGYGFKKVEPMLLHVTRIKMWDVDNKKELEYEITEMLRAADAGNIWLGEW